MKVGVKITDVFKRNALGKRSFLSYIITTDMLTVGGWSCFTEHFHVSSVKPGYNK